MMETLLRISNLSEQSQILYLIIIIVVTLVIGAVLEKTLERWDTRHE